MTGDFPGTRAARATAVRRAAAVAAAVTCAAAVTACGTARAPAAGSAPAPAALPLAASLAGSQVSWAAVPMGTAAPGPDQFWELFARPAAGTRWVLATPPDAATNGAIAMAMPGGGAALTAGIRPSQNLRFSPVTATADGGQAWTPGSPAAGLASVPDALAEAPGATAALVALGRDGRVTEAAGAGASWAALASTASVAATPAGRACGVRELTAVAFSLTGQPVVGAACARPGVAGIFTLVGRTWQAAAVPVPAALAGRPLLVLGLARAGGRLTALLETVAGQSGTGQASTGQASTGQTGARRAGGGRVGMVFAAWTTGGAWAVSAPLAGEVSSISAGVDGTPGVTLAGGRAAVLAGTAWRALPALPAAPHVVLAVLAGGTIQALATREAVLTVWQLSAAGAWEQVQRTTVPLQFGSST